MTTNIDADVFIFQNNDKTQAIKYIADSGLDEETKDYYCRMISVKTVIENNLTEAERFLFKEYFSGYSLKEMRRQYDLSKFDMSKYSKRPRMVLADAIFKFYVLTAASPEFPVDKLNSLLLEIKTFHGFRFKHKATLYQDLYSTIYSFDTVNKNIFAFSTEDFPLLDYVYRSAESYWQLQSRAIKSLHISHRGTE